MKISSQKIHVFLVNLWALACWLCILAFGFVAFFGWLPSIFDDIPEQESLDEIQGELLNIKKLKGVGSTPSHYALTLRTENGELTARLKLRHISSAWEEVLDKRKPLRAGMRLTVGVDDKDKQYPWILDLRTGQLKIISYEHQQQVVKNTRDSSGKFLLFLLGIALLLAAIAVIYGMFLKWLKRGNE